MSITSLLLLIVMVSGLIYLIIDSDEDTQVRARIDKLTKHHAQKDNAFKTLGESIVEFVKPFSSMFFRNQSQKDELKNLLLQAGKDFSEDAILKFILIQAALGYIGIPFAVMLSLKGDMMMALLAILLPVSAFILPKILIANMIKKRQAHIRRFLPDILELLTVCVEAGLGLDAALARVSKEYYRTSPLLAKEFERINNDILSGISREQAFRGLAHRNNIEELKSFVALLIQTDKLGTSIAKALRIYCDTIRTKKRQRIEELSQQASTKMTIPMVGCLLPALFAIILTPAVMVFMTSMK